MVRIRVSGSSRRRGRPGRTLRLRAQQRLALLELLEHADHLGRHPVARAPRALAQAGEGVAERALPGRVAKQRQELAVGIEPPAPSALADEPRPAPGDDRHGAQQRLEGRAHRALGPRGGRVAPGGLFRRRIERSVVDLQRAAGRAQHAQRHLGALGVAAEPEQVLGHPARELPLDHRVVARRLVRADQRLGHDGPVREHPDVLAADERLERGAPSALGVVEQAQSARHQLVVVAALDQEGTHRDLVVHALVALEAGGERAVDAFLGDVAFRRERDVALEGRVPVAAHQARVEQAPAGVDVAKQQLVEARAHVRERALLAEPVGRGGREQQLLPEQLAAERRQAGVEGGVVEHAAAERVDDLDLAGAHGLQESGHAAPAAVVDGQRIGIRVVDKAQDDVHPLQARHGAQVHPLVAHGQVAELDEGVAEVLREPGELEVVAMGSRRSRAARSARRGPSRRPPAAGGCGSSRPRAAPGSRGRAAGGRARAPGGSRARSPPRPGTGRCRRPRTTCPTASARRRRSRAAAARCRAGGGRRAGSRRARTPWQAARRRRRAGAARRRCRRAAPA